MVWGMAIPDKFGEFWPNGEFEGGSWSERLDSFCQSQPPEVQKALFDYGPGGGITSYPTYVSGKFKSEVGAIGFPEDPPFTPIREHEPPRSFDTVKNCPSLGSLIALNFGLLAVDKALMAIVERLEPGVHQFFPIEIRMPNGQVYPEIFHIFVIGQYFDSFSPENSNDAAFRVVPNSNNRVSYDGSKKSITGLALSRSIFSSAYVWRERRFTRLITCFSDEIKLEIDKSGIRMPAYYKMMEV
jgi:hypothetical protein